MRAITSLLILVGVISINAQGEKGTFNQMSKLFPAFFNNNPNLVPGFVRLSFHDCVGGICDGCVDLTNPENAGLSVALQAAIDFRNQNAPSWSLADIIAFLGRQALQHAGSGVSVPYSAGRADCDSSNGLPQRHPPGGFILNTLNFLENEFSLTTREAVALIGCHSLGRTNTANSGFEGPWDLTPLELDNGYFQNLRACCWNQEVRNNSKVTSTQWSKPRPFMMLHADMIIFKQFTISGDFDTPSCQYSNCAAATTANLVNEYADNEANFHRDISVAFRKMIDIGQSNLRLLS